MLKKYFVYAYITLGFSSLLCSHLAANNQGASRRDCLAIGQAVYDIFFQVDDATLNKLLPTLELNKGQSKMLSCKQLSVLEAAVLFPCEQSAGGSSANTIAGIASLGGTSTFVGIACNDNYGKRFIEDLEQCGIKNECTLIDNPKGTGRIFVLISPDGERTMPANFGIANDIQLINPKIFSEQNIGAYKIVYSDAYLWATPDAREVIAQSFDIARKCAVACAFSLGTELVVAAHREDLLKFLNKVDILLGNEAEMKALMGTRTQEQTLAQLGEKTQLAVMTCGAQGAWIVHKNQQIFIAPESVTAVDLTGAGDMFAAGFLYGIAHEYSLLEAGKLGSRMSGHIIQSVGARPQRTLEFLKPEVDMS